MSQNDVLNDEFADLLQALLDADARFLVVGAHAMGAHGVTRATGDLDVLVQASPDNAPRVWAALRAFGAPVAAHGLSIHDFERPGIVYQVGSPPRRIDLLTIIDGVSFAEAWEGRTSVRIGALDLPVLGLEALRRTKAAAARPKDLLDLILLDQAGASLAPRDPPA